MNSSATTLGLFLTPPPAPSHISADTELIIVSGNGSGDLFLAFSTANPGASDAAEPTRTVQTVPNDRMDALFTATVQATEEAILNALVDNQPMTGRDGHHVDALPRNRMRELLKKYNRAP